MPVVAREVDVRHFDADSAGTARNPVVREVPFKVPFRLTGSQSGLMISELSPCLCGEQRLKWHPVCLKVKVNG